MYDPRFNYNSEQPAKRTLVLRLRHDVLGRPFYESISQEAVSLSPEGSIDRVLVTHDRFYDCGCSYQHEAPTEHCAEPGCRHISCLKCSRRCQRCKRAFCLQHQMKILDMPEWTFCAQCDDDMTGGWFRSRTELNQFIESYNGKYDFPQRLLSE